MTVFDAYLKVRAAAEDRALPRASMCHRHLSDEPLVIVTYKLAGDPASPVGVLVGTDREDPHFFCAPEPRNRDLRFGLINPFAEIVLQYLNGYEPIEGDPGAMTERPCPQLVVPNTATAQFLEVLGRSIRHPGPAGLIPPTTVQAGRHLAWFGGQSEHPGQALVLPMTDLLCQHWTTGQSALEDELLAAVLAWVTPGPEGAAAAAIAAEDGPTAGPASSPQWDKRHLDPAISDFNTARNGSTDPSVVDPLAEEVRAVVRTALEAAWTDTWTALDLLRGLPPAAHATARRGRDVEAWERWWRRSTGDDVRLRNTLSDREAIWLLAEREADTELVLAQECADDPLRFVAQEVDGTGVRGDVDYAEPDRRIVPPGRSNRVLRPLIRLRLAHENHRVVAGDSLCWTERDGGVSMTVLDRDDATMTLEITSGVNRSRGVAPDLPTQLGRTVRLTSLSLKKGPVKPLHSLRETWTHRRTEDDVDAINDVSTDASTPTPATPAS
ncbi:hypothetical protein [Geodermatophilus ruber]|uniref:Uncharacterized protein n=1 Tax=Geodermatophilus ruber TaxID=504800 RepID=A0A1I4H714_9ACTN|nr:hypothetical protein [Geodermatophilus ruber]SFL37443.1 hypothetical protein SAMN04488085_11044 [Geodermatophilus ruber]